MCVRVCAEAGSSRVGIRGQSSLYAVCWAPRQKHCWAVKHSVTETTCSRVYDRQTQAASASLYQELVPYHRGLGGSILTPVQHSCLALCVLYASGNWNQEQTVLGKKKKKVVQERKGTNLVWQIFKCNLSRLLLYLAIYCQTCLLANSLWLRDT